MDSQPGALRLDSVTRNSNDGFHETVALIAANRTYMFFVSNGSQEYCDWNAGAVPLASTMLMPKLAWL